jgi:hypothetical protein
MAECIDEQYDPESRKWSRRIQEVNVIVAISRQAESWEREETQNGE